MKNYLSVGVVILAVSGCVSMRDVPAGYALSERSNEGLAVVSLTLSGKDLDNVYRFEYRLRPAPPGPGQEVERTRHFNSALQHARWLIEDGGRDTTSRRVVVKDSAAGGPLLDIVDSGKAVGRLVTLPLPAGDYELVGWQIVVPSPYGRDEFTPKQTMRYGFHVAAGRATYLGNLDLHLPEHDRYSLSVKNNATRDLAVLEQKVPGVKAEDIIYEAGELAP